MSGTTGTTRRVGSGRSGTRSADGPAPVGGSGRGSQGSRRATGGRSAAGGSVVGRGPRDRFEGRRLDVERREGLRRLRLVIGLAVVASLAVGVIAFVNSSWFDVDEVAVAGNERAAADDIVEASGIERGDGLLEVDLGRAARSVELVPWVGTATVSRSWSGTILIEVEERPPSVAIPAGGRFALVDDHGRQLELVDRRPADYLPIRGIEGSGVAGEAAPDAILPVIAVIDALPPATRERVASVAVVGDDIHLELVGGGLANLGDGTELGRKLQAFETVLARVDLTCLDTIDVRAPDAPAVTRTAELPPLDPDEPDVAPVQC
jgi:cell division protein FtsQ